MHQLKRGDRDGPESLLARVSEPYSDAMSTEPESHGEESTDSAVGKETPLESADAGPPEPLVTTSGVAVRIDGSTEGTVFSVQNGDLNLAGIAELLTGLGAAATAASVVAKAKIEGRVEVRKAEIEAATRRLEITEETKREQMRLQTGQPAPEPTEGG